MAAGWRLKTICRDGEFSTPVFSSFSRIVRRAVSKLPRTLGGDCTLDLLILFDSDASGFGAVLDRRLSTSIRIAGLRADWIFCQRINFLFCKNRGFDDFRSVRPPIAFHHTAQHVAQRGTGGRVSIGDARAPSLRGMKVSKKAAHRAVISRGCSTGNNALF